VPEADTALAPQPRAHVVVVANEKGGTGKSTTAMHLIVAALRQGFSVATIDLDAGQGSLTRYIENRARFGVRHEATLPLPHHAIFASSQADSRAAAAEDERGRLSALVAELAPRFDALVIDTPGGDTPAVREAITRADTLITPVNDSFIDLDLLGRVEGSPPKIVAPGRFSAVVWDQRKARAQRTGGSIDWVVLRNRLTTLGSRNKAAMADTLQELSKRVGFRLADGFGDRVIFRELFFQGLTVLDLRDEGVGFELTLSHVAARQEVRRLIEFIGLAGKIAPAERPGKARLSVSLQTGPGAR
jgi:chromosome partitioning protein